MDYNAEQYIVSYFPEMKDTGYVIFTFNSPTVAEIASFLISAPYPLNPNKILKSSNLFKLNFKHRSCYGLSCIFRG